MSSEIAVLDPPQHRGLATVPRAAAMAEVLAEQGEIRRVLGQYIQANMQPDIDYGVIPGTKNATLLQPGAEKMAEIFRCNPVFTVTKRVEDWERGLFHYEFKCELVQRDTGSVICEGVGSCNSFEKKYRWRTANRKCPLCGAEAIIKGKAEYGGGWLCWKKKDGCDAKFADGDQSIESQAGGRVQNEDIADCTNTILKMSKKRALVDACVVLCRRYGFQYAQDVEDHTDRAEPPHQQAVVLVSPDGVKALTDWLRAAKIDWSNAEHRAKFEQRLGVKLTTIPAMTDDQARAAIAYCQEIHTRLKQSKAATPAKAEQGDAYEPPPAEEATVNKVSAERVKEILAAITTAKLTWPKVRQKLLIDAGHSGDHIINVTDMTAEVADRLLGLLTAQAQAA